MAHGRQGFMNWFTRLAMDGGEILVYAPGDQLRDLVYVDDAVHAFLLAGADPAADGQAFNVGSGDPVSVRRLAETLVAAAGRGAVRMVEYPADQRPIEIGVGLHRGDRSRFETELFRPSGTAELAAARAAHVAT